MIYEHSLSVAGCSQVFFLLLVEIFVYHFLCFFGELLYCLNFA